MTDFIIKLKLSYDSATLAISNVFAEKYMKHIYLGMYWLSTLFLIIKFKIDGEIRGLYFLAAAFICLRAFKYTTNYLNNSNKIIKYFVAPSILIAFIAYSTSNSFIFNSEIEKNIKSFSHNLTHSYSSFENYDDGEFVYKSLKEMVYAAKGEKVSIYWIFPEGKIQPIFNERINKSIEYYKGWIPKLMAQHEIEKESVVELRTDIYLAKNGQIEVQSYAKDINGKEYIKNIYGSL